MIIQWFANSVQHQRVVDLNIISFKILDGNGVNAKPKSIPALNFGLFENKKKYRGSLMSKKANILDRLHASFIQEKIYPILSNWRF